MTTPERMPSPPVPARGRWIRRAACAWALAFAAPHVWWALGVPFGFPGGEESHRRFMTGWRYLYDLVVVFLCGVAVLVVLAPVRAWGSRVPRWIPTAGAWAASALLSIRGLGGLLIDGASDPVWWPTFLAGGLLFGAVAWANRAPARPGAPALR